MIVRYTENTLNEAPLCFDSGRRSPGAWRWAVPVRNVGDEKGIQ